MRLGEGVEWALHCCLNLAWVGSRGPVPAARLAAFHELPSAYLNKQLQALARAGIVASVPGPRGGFQLARSPGEISLMDVVVAIDGPAEVFRCTEIRQRGPAAGPPDPTGRRCLIAVAMNRAELAWRRELASQTIAEIQASVEREAPQVVARTRRWFGVT